MNIYVHRSKDFASWVKVNHPLHSVKSTGMWECPDFFPVSLKGKKGCNTSECGKTPVFKVSSDVTRYKCYTIGTYSHEMDRCTHSVHTLLAMNSTDLRIILVFLKAKLVATYTSIIQITHQLMITQD